MPIAAAIRSAGSRLIRLMALDPSRRKPSSPSTVRVDLGVAHVVEREAVAEQADERADRGAGVVVLGLAEEQRRAALDVAQVDVVAERGADDGAARGGDQHDLRLRDCSSDDIGWMPTSARWPTAAIGGALVKISASGPDADLEILRPHALVDQQRLERHRLRRAGLQPGEIVADEAADLGAHRRRPAPARRAPAPR